ncbi:hypothetical protein ARMGADRAFT_1037939 [Armillaria gallica]|uniref:Uncharacterized protein n=1 Tax=Armillaria gallica TaxID=47427 RepID=A0A2H3D4Q3_ARMGA|nr:hypothetical protein ARMGADRAFT_1037939 [Armillaria gallica]
MLWLAAEIEVFKIVMLQLFCEDSDVGSDEGYSPLPCVWVRRSFIVRERRGGFAPTYQANPTAALDILVLVGDIIVVWSQSVSALRKDRIQLCLYDIQVCLRCKQQGATAAWNGAGGCHPQQRLKMDAVGIKTHGNSRRALVILGWPSDFEFIWFQVCGYEAMKRDAHKDLPKRMSLQLEGWLRVDQSTMQTEEKFKSLRVATNIGLFHVVAVQVGAWGIGDSFVEGQWMVRLKQVNRRTGNYPQTTVFIGDDFNQQLETMSELVPERDAEPAPGGHHFDPLHSAIIQVTSICGRRRRRILGSKSIQYGAIGRCLDAGKERQTGAIFGSLEKGCNAYKGAAGDDAVTASLGSCGVETETVTADMSGARNEECASYRKIQETLEARDGVVEECDGRG